MTFENLITLFFGVWSWESSSGLVGRGDLGNLRVQTPEQTPKKTPKFRAFQISFVGQGGQGKSGDLQLNSKLN